MKLVLSENAKKLLIESVEALINDSNKIIDRIFIDENNYIKLLHYTPHKEIKLNSKMKNNFYKNKNNLL